MDIILLLRAERDKVARQLNGLNAAIAAFAGSQTDGASRPRRKMNSAARARIAAAQRARWAKQKGKASKSAPKRHISAAGLANIRAAQRARWRKVRSGKK